MSSLLRVKEPFAVDQGGFHRVLRVGDLLNDDDPVITDGRHRFFEPVEATVTREQARIESASAAPGELREVGKPRRGAAKKAAAVKAD